MRMIISLLQFIQIYFIRQKIILKALWLRTTDLNNLLPAEIIIILLLLN